MKHRFEWGTEHRHANKEYECEVCDNWISKKEEYVRVAVFQDKSVTFYKMHLGCYKYFYDAVVLELDRFYHDIEDTLEYVREERTRLNKEERAILAVEARYDEWKERRHEHE